MYGSIENMKTVLSSPGFALSPDQEQEQGDRSRFFNHCFIVTHQPEVYLWQRN